MSHIQLEHRPLLASAYSAEDLRPADRRRCRKSVRGAAFIITRWPDHWCSVLVYWWIMIGVVALTFMLLYNTIAAFVLFPALNSKELTKPAHFTDLQITKEPIQIEVYMHIFTNIKDGTGITYFLPYVEDLSKMYLGLNFNLIVILNDTNHNNLEKNSLKENNDEALSLLFKNKTKLNKNLTIGNNIDIRYVCLSKFMNESPLKHTWRLVKTQIIPFLVRAISIWDKGGVVFDPIILTNKTPDPKYMSKLTMILQQLHTQNKFVGMLPHDNGVHSGKISRPNNIQDIIKALENNLTSISDHDIAEAENIISEIVVPSKADYQKYTENNYKGDILIPHNITKSSVAESGNKLEISEHDLEIMDQSILLKRSPKVNPNDDENRNVKVNAKYLLPGTIGLSVSSENLLVNCNKNNVMCLDRNGYLMATQTSCHAFIGTMFSNIQQFVKVVNVTEFLVQELSIFCKGTLFTCAAIDLF